MENRNCQTCYAYNFSLFSPLRTVSLWCSTDPISWARFTPHAAQDTLIPALTGLRWPRGQSGWEQDDRWCVVWPLWCPQVPTDVPGIYLGRNPHSYNTSGDCCWEKAQGFPWNRRRKNQWLKQFFRESLITEKQWTNKCIIKKNQREIITIGSVLVFLNAYVKFQR